MGENAEMLGFLAGTTMVAFVFVLAKVHPVQFPLAVVVGGIPGAIIAGRERKTTWSVIWP
jgi:hypothetical protein